MRNGGNGSTTVRRDRHDVGVLAALCVAIVSCAKSEAPSPSTLAPTSASSATSGPTAWPLPIGSILAFAAPTPPGGWLLCDGKDYPISEYPALAKKIKPLYGGKDDTSFRLPDLRGRFLRGADSAHALGGTQLSNTGSHTHNVNVSTGWRNDTPSHVTRGDKNYDNGTVQTTETGGTETRPVNVYVEWIIRGT